MASLQALNLKGIKNLLIRAANEGQKMKLYVRQAPFCPGCAVPPMGQSQLVPGAAVEGSHLKGCNRMDTELLAGWFIEKPGTCFLLEHCIFSNRISHFAGTPFSCKQPS